MAIKSLFLLLALSWRNALGLRLRTSPNAGLVQNDRAAHPDRYTEQEFEDAILSAPDLIIKYGYPVEKHTIITEDGYILELHRIPRGKEDTAEEIKPRPVILVLHGLLASSADFIILGPNKALGYVLADAGFDVWLGNARGNFYSREHISKDPDSYFDTFWDFSWEEIGRYDLAAMVDHVLNTTGQPQLHYIGHSQGTTSFMVLNSLRPEYNAKFISAHLLAPVVFMEHFPTSHLGELAKFTNVIYKLGNLMGLNEIFPRGSLMTHTEGRYKCVYNMLTALCETIISMYGEINNTVLHGHFPAGSSLKQIAHYGQNIEYSNFQRWDYGIIKNYLHYGNSVPPKYDISTVTVKIILYYSESDDFVSEKDVFNLAKVLPNAAIKKVARFNFDHFDFGNDLEAKELVYDEIVEFIKNYI